MDHFLLPTNAAFSLQFWLLSFFHFIQELDNILIQVFHTNYCVFWLFFCSLLPFFKILPPSIKNYFEFAIIKLSFYYFILPNYLVFISSILNSNMLIIYSEFTIIRLFPVIFVSIFLTLPLSLRLLFQILH